MIHVAGSARHSFVFPGERARACAYFADISRHLNYLPHICLIRAYGSDCFRLLYSATELGIYHVRIFADVQASLDPEWVLHIRPLNNTQPVSAEAGVHSSTAQGTFESRSIFSDEGDSTRIEYSLQLRACLPTPLGLRFVPGTMVQHTSNSITRLRMREIIEGFIERSTEAFSYWLAENEDPGCPPKPPRPLPPA